MTSKPIKEIERIIKEKKTLLIINVHINNKIKLLYNRRNTVINVQSDIS